MSAISRRHYDQLEASLTALSSKWCDFHNVGLSHDEFLALFAPPEHHKMLKEAAEIAQVDSNGGYHNVAFSHERFKTAFGSETVHLCFHLRPQNGLAPLMPRNTVILSTAFPETLERLADWVIERVKINTSINRAKAVLSWLANNCSTANEVRFLWPTLIAVASLHDDTKDFGHKLREVRAPKSLPAIPFEVKAGLKASAGAVASAMLLGNPEPFSAPVTVSINRVDVSRREGALGYISGY